MQQVVDHPILKPNWVPVETTHSSPGNFTSDELINAYLQGRQEGEDFYRRSVVAAFRTNFDRATGYCEAMAKAIEQAKISLQGVRLRIDTPEVFTALFLVSEDDLLADGFEQIYIHSIALKAEYREEKNFDLAFVFLAGQGFNELKAETDGFRLRYAAEA